MLIRQTLTVPEFDDFPRPLQLISGLSFLLEPLHEKQEPRKANAVSGHFGMASLLHEVLECLVRNSEGQGLTLQSIRNN